LICVLGITKAELQAVSAAVAKATGYSSATSATRAAQAGD
jgi:hypothetical protein